MSYLVDTSHDCGNDGAPEGAIPVVRKAASHCCGAVLAEGGTEQDGYACTGCGGPADRVLGDPVAYWTCGCGQPRQQQVTLPQDRS